MASTSPFLERYGPYIDGKLQSGVEDITVRDPATNDPVTVVADSGEDRVDEAIRSCEAAREDWEGLDGVERGRVLSAIAGALRDDQERFARIETLENGRPISASMKRVETAARYFEYYAGLADKVEGKSIPVDGGRLDYTVQEPYGVTAQVIPWNSSLLLGARGLAPSLAVGNTIVAKVDPQTPASVVEFARLASDAGLPDGVMNVVPGDVERTGAPLTSDPRVRHIVFTGSVPGGTAVMKAAADNVVPVNLELGGKSPSLVFPDADLDAAAEGTVNVFGNAGQVCFATTRVYVHEDVYEPFMEKVVDRAEELSVGPGMDDHDVGPLVSPAAQDRVTSYVDGAVADGARVRTGGEVPREEGNFYAPTVLDEVADDAAISCEEVFGPVVTAYEFTDEVDVLRRANDSEYGLYATVWTSDLDRAHRFAGELEAGTVSVNEFPVTPAAAPFGGYKKSGIGREKGLQVLDHYTETKNVVVNVDREFE
ncbi:aldehyde dehydrogenase family protein [Halobacteriales archaeon Cl-PHB]